MNSTQDLLHQEFTWMFVFMSLETHKFFGSCN